MASIAIPNVAYLLEYTRKRTEQFPNFFSGVKDISLKRAFILIVSMSWLLPSFRIGSKSIFLANERVAEYFPKDELRNMVIIGGPKEFLSSLKLDAGFLNASSLYIAVTLYCFVSYLSTPLFKKCFKNVSKKMSAQLRSKILLTDSDGLPYARSVCSAARLASVKIICLQHGIFHYPFNGIDGSQSDYNFVKDAKQLEILTKSGIPSSRLSIMNDIIKSHEDTKIKTKSMLPKIILVGEGYYSHNKKIDKDYTSFLYGLKKVFLQNGLKVYFRPHPSEKRRLMNYIHLFPFIISKRGKNLNTNDIYIGATSTLLFDVATIGGKAIQVYDVINIGMDFSMYGVVRCSKNSVLNTAMKLLCFNSNEERTIRESYIDLRRLYSKIRNNLD